MDRIEDDKYFDNNCICLLSGKYYIEMKASYYNEINIHYVPKKSEEKMIWRSMKNL